MACSITISFPEAAIVLISTKKSRSLGEIRRRTSFSHSGYSLYACSETVIELIRMRPERRAFGHRWPKARGLWGWDWFHQDSNHESLFIDWIPFSCCFVLYWCSLTHKCSALDFSLPYQSYQWGISDENSESDHWKETLILKQILPTITIWNIQGPVRGICVLMACFFI